MYKRFSIKIVGSSGQGINILGEILAKSFKRLGYSVFAYREYPSLIKGGHATYQIEVSDQQIEAVSMSVDIVMILNKQATKWHLEELREGGVIFHDIDNPRINNEEAKLILQKDIKLVYIPALKLAIESGGSELTSNIVTIGSIWKSLSKNLDVLEKVIEEKFSDKPKIIPIDIECVKAGYSYQIGELPNFKQRMLRNDEITDEKKGELHVNSMLEVKQKINFKIIPDNLKSEDFIQLSGNEALSIGAVNAGVRIHYSYPMTPSSSILDFLSEAAHKTGMIVKQAEDEITAAAMAIGSMYMGTRAMVATSGGGFDLMTEHLSLAAMIEVPFVCVIAQRPGPATGLPTWTAQSDLLLSIFSGHGEFSRCVIGIKNATDAFYSIQEAFNISEEYQIPVIVLTDKYIAESLYSIKSPDTNLIKIKRGRLITSAEELSKLKSTDRYKITENGISPRWLPGDKAADFDSNSDEHDEEGNVTEDAQKAEEMIHKRLLKNETLTLNLEDPEIFTNSIRNDAVQKEINIIGWGSTYSVIHDVMKIAEDEGIKINYMHIKYMWPLKTQKILDFYNLNPDKIAIIEGNATGQMSQLLKLSCGIDIEYKLLKWDGRPFFIEEVLDFIKSF